MKKWKIINKIKNQKSLPRRQAGKIKIDIINCLLSNRGFNTKKQIEQFIQPIQPQKLTSKDVGINQKQLNLALTRIKTAIKNKESIVVYADYDADGITAGATMWEVIYKMGGKVMPYIPHRVDEGYGLSQKGIDFIKKEHHVKLIITVDQGVTAWDKIEYAKKQGIDVVVTDHHVLPKKIPQCILVHTTQLSGSGISWFVAYQLHHEFGENTLELATIGTIADMVPLTGANRSIVKHGLEKIAETKRIGINALIDDARLDKQAISTYDISHIIAPRLNAMGRLEHALDALRLLCTKQKDKAQSLAKKLGLKNIERQKLTEDTTLQAINFVNENKITKLKKILFIGSETYNQGVIGLVAGKLVEEFYLPAIVYTQGEKFSKASARSISGFNIIETIRKCEDLLVDAGGHPMAAGFTVETAKLSLLQKKLEQIAEEKLNPELLTRKLIIDTTLDLEQIDLHLWEEIQKLAPFGMANFEPVFATKNVKIIDAKTVGFAGKHLKLTLANKQGNFIFDAIGFGMGEIYSQLNPEIKIDIAYTIDLNVWNGNKKLQLKLKDIQI